MNVTSNPEILCQKLIEINKNYIIPNFNYQCKENIIDNISNLNEKNSENLFEINFNSVKQLVNQKNKQLNKYNNSCIKVLNYLNRNDIIHDFEESMLNQIYNMFSQNLISFELFLQNNINNIKNVFILSLYFSKYPYYLNILTFDEVKDIFEKEFSFEEIFLLQLNLYDSIGKLCEKINKKESILVEKNELKKMQESFISLLCYCWNNSKLIPTNFTDFYQIINFFRDIDFCLKILVMSVISIINNKKYDFMEMCFSLVVSDSRITLYSIYLKILCLNEYEQFTEEEKKIINDTLTIKDFIIIGNNDFHEKIKIIENEIISNSFMYLNIEQLSKYIEEKLNEKIIKIVDYFYFLIIRYEDYQENFEELILLSIKLGITFIIFLYVEKEDNIKINKEKIEIFQILFPIILIYSPNDIITYLSNKLNFYNPLDDLDTKSIRDIINLKIPETSFEQNNEKNIKVDVLN